jgi:hypothetical protein
MLSVVSEDNVEVMRRVRVPNVLTDEQAAEFRFAVDSMPAEWFCPGNTALLCQYARHVVMAKRIAQLIEKAALDPDGAKQLKELILAQERETSIICRLMTLLRLTPQSVQPSRSSARLTHQAESPWSGLKQIAQNS